MGLDRQVIRFGLHYRESRFRGQVRTDHLQELFAQLTIAGGDSAFQLPQSLAMIGWHGK